MQEVPNVGALCVPTARRDCIHVAVAPVKARHGLDPGLHVCVADGEAWEPKTGDPAPVGVVDPFLKDWIPPGAVFWVFLYPGTITSLRHVFSHPAFTTQLPKGET